MKKPKNQNKQKSKYEENLEVLLREVTHNKHTYFKKETRNVIKTKEETPIEEKPIEEKPVEEKPLEEKPTEEKPVEGIVSKEIKVEEKQKQKQNRRNTGRKGPKQDRRSKGRRKRKQKGY